MRFSALCICVAMVIMAGCSAPLDSTPFGRSAQGDNVGGRSAQGDNVGTRYVPGDKGSWMRPEAKSGDLLYVDEYGGGVVDVFTFPRGRLVGQLGGFITPEGECIDEHADVFIVNLNENHGPASIEEFAHGGLVPLESLSDTGQLPYSCSIDPKTGNLAVGNDYGVVSVYRKAQGSPTFIADPYMGIGLWVGYDASGDLFYDGLNSKITTEFDELPKGKTTFKPIALNQTVGFPGNIQWDGSHLTLVDALYHGNDTSAIYQLTISGSTGKILGTTVLHGSEEVFGSWIQGKRVVGPEDGPSFEHVDYWPYPAGGNATKSLGHAFNGPFAAAVSP